MRYLQKLLDKPQQTNTVLHLINKSPSATVFDNSGYGNNGTITGATWVRLPSGLWVNSFDGTDDKVTIGNASSLNFGTGNFSVRAWFKCVDALDYRQILAKIMNGAPWTGYFLRLDQTNGKLNFQGYQTAIAGNTNYADNQWHWAVGTFEAGVADTGMKLYVDGVENVAIRATASAEDKDTTNSLFIGVAQDGTSFPFKGLMGLIGADSRVLSATEIAGIYQRERHLFGV